MKADLIVRNIGLLYTSEQKPPVHGSLMPDISVISEAFIAVKDGLFLEIGSGDGADLQDDNTKIFDAEGMIVLPGLIDSHTHLVFGGSREHEFAMKLQGVHYLDILQSGGGILETVSITRTSSFDDLYNQARESLDEMLRFGVTAIEAKSGYGLDLETEIKQLQVIKKLQQTHPVELFPTYLGAHALPKEYQDDKPGFIAKVIQDMEEIKRQNLASFVDVFCEKGVFELEDTRTILEAAKTLGMIPRIHADEMHPLGGTELGIAYHAASVDHLMAVTTSGMEMLGKSDTIATLLPGTSFFLNHDYAKARELIAYDAAVAIASDFNPGSSPSENFQLTMQLAGNKLRMTPEEILTASTINPAYGLMASSRIGSIQKGKQADFVIMKAKNLAYVIYHFGINHARHVFKKGVPVVIDRTIQKKE